ncbi:MAG: hypothetical protein AABY55_06170, partial [Candidatus Omnitrophota bacterium]
PKIKTQINNITNNSCIPIPKILITHLLNDGITYGTTVNVSYMPELIPKLKPKLSQENFGLPKQGILFLP